MFYLWSVVHLTAYVNTTYLKAPSAVFKHLSMGNFLRHLRLVELY